VVGSSLLLYISFCLIPFKALDGNKRLPVSGPVFHVEVITVSAAMLKDAVVRTSISPHVGTKKDKFPEFSFLLA
jgi:hypothetical protein